MWKPRTAAEAERAETAVKFIRHLKHGKGEWAGRPFNLQPWQQHEIIEPLFGAMRPNGTRQYRQAYIEIPRKNGKTEIAAAIALKLLMADGERGGEVYCAASDSDQASIVFSAAASMVRQSPLLKRRCKVVEHTKRIVVMEGPYAGSFLRAIPADEAGAHGFNASAVIADEVHAWAGRGLWDVLRTSTGARRQPLTVAITTAGYDRTSLCWELHEHARQVIEGTVDDPSLLPLIYGAADEDDWTDPKIWRKANPNLGIAISEEYFTEAVREAEQMPSAQNAFRRLHLDEWTAAESRWMPMPAWDATAGVVDEQDLLGRECYGGLDIANTTDIAAYVLVFPPDNPDGLYRVLPRFWIPRETMREKVRRDRVPYDEWERRGLLTATEGSSIDYAFIRREIEKSRLQYQVQEIAFDRWGAVQLTQELAAAGMEPIQFGQGYTSMSPPTKELMRLVVERRLAHGGNPILRWMADNVMVEQDAAGNIKPSKRKSTQKIDGIVGLVMALDRAIRHEHKPVMAFLGTDGGPRPDMPPASERGRALRDAWT